MTTNRWSMTICTSTTNTTSTITLRLTRLANPTAIHTDTRLFGILIPTTRTSIIGTSTERHRGTRCRSPCCEYGGQTRQHGLPCPATDTLAEDAEFAEENVEKETKRQ